MNVNDLVTKGDLDALAKRLEALLAPAAGAPPPAAGDDYLSIDEVAQLTGFNRKTVQKWIAQGKYDRKGKLITLYTLEFAPGFPRIPRSALVAFGQGVGFDTSRLMPPPPMRVAS
ncbi:hypothetical protein GCM10027048_20120 [Hymenobacter coalescens]